LEAQVLDDFEAAEESGQLLGQRRFKLKQLARKRLRELEVCGVEKISAEPQSLQVRFLASGGCAPGGGLLG
jgi:hypothetical protein